MSTQVQEFIIVGITAAVRHGLTVAAAGASAVTLGIGVRLAVNSLSVLILVAALWLVRQQAAPSPST